MDFYFKCNKSSLKLFETSNKHCRIYCFGNYAIKKRIKTWKLKRIKMLRNIQNIRAGVRNESIGVKNYNMVYITK